MAKFQSPLLGYNNNVRHKNRIFHIQTEDSGVNHPHIITHLFMDGGRILKSVKRSYAEHVGAEGMSETVRGLMKEQHKAMFIALRDGQFDYLVEPAPGAPVPIAAPKKTLSTDALASPVTRPDPPRSDPEPAPATVDETRSPPPLSTTEIKKRPDPVLAPLGANARAAPPPSPPPAQPITEQRHLLLADTDEVPTAARQAPPPSLSAQELTLDFDALERAATHQENAPPTASSLFQAHDLPPPPKNLFAKEPGTGTYRAVESDAHRSPAPAQHGSVKPSGRAPSRSPSRPAADARYAPARPAAIFGAAQKAPPQSIFGDELISDKSLDEVILSYLAEDLEPPRRK